MLRFALQTLLEGDGLNTPDRVSVLDGGPALVGRTEEMLHKTKILRCSRTSTTKWTTRKRRRRCCSMIMTAWMSTRGCFSSQQRRPAAHESGLYAIMLDYCSRYQYAYCIQASVACPGRAARREAARKVRIRQRPREARRDTRSRDTEIYARLSY